MPPSRLNPPRSTCLRASRCSPSRSSRNSLRQAMVIGSVRLSAASSSPLICDLMEQQSPCSEFPAPPWLLSWRNGRRPRYSLRRGASGNGLLRQGVIFWARTRQIARSGIGSLLRLTNPAETRQIAALATRMKVPCMAISDRMHPPPKIQPAPKTWKKHTPTPHVQCSPRSCPDFDVRAQVPDVQCSNFSGMSPESGHLSGDSDKYPFENACHLLL